MGEIWPWAACLVAGAVGLVVIPYLVAKAATLGYLNARRRFKLDHPDKGDD